MISEGWRRKWNGQTLKGFQRKQTKLIPSMEHFEGEPMRSYVTSQLTHGPPTKQGSAEPHAELTSTQLRRHARYWSLTPSPVNPPLKIDCPWDPTFGNHN